MLISGAFADSAVTDPVGYVTMPIVQKAGAAPGVSFIGATLVNKIEFSGAAAVAGSGTTVTLPSVAGPFPANSILPTAQPAFYFEITSGPNAGKWTDCVSTTAGTALTLSDALGDLVTVGTTFAIRKHHTFDSLFGSTVATLALNGGVDLNEADEVQILAPGGAPTSYFYSTDDLGIIGWVNVSTGQAAGQAVIAPGEGLKVIRRNDIAKPSIVQVGHVKTGPTEYTVESGFNIINVPLSTGWTATDAQYLATGLLGGVDLGSADVVELFAGGVGTSYFSSTDDLNPGLLPGNIAAPEGTAIRIKRQAGTGFNMKFPAQVIAN